jgi:hypothetical protein
VARLFARKEWSSMFRGASCAVAAALAICVIALTGCGKSGSSGSLITNLRPTIEISAGPIQGTEVFYSVRLNWFASDADGQVVRYIYATDPPVEGDTTWIETRSSEVTVFFHSTAPTDSLHPVLPPLGSVIISRNYHTFVVKAIDNEGAASQWRSLSFTSRTTAPSTQIQAPHPTDQQPVTTTPSVTINWRGIDPDGVLTQKPVKYKFKIVPADVINPTNPQGITPPQVQDYFGADADNYFAQWDSVSGDTTSKFYEGLTPQRIYFFAIVAFDEAGAFEPRFNMNTNVLQFRPTLGKLGPDITVSNSFFSRTQSTGGISLNASRIYTLEFPADQTIPMNWFATADVGAIVTGYRWALDIEGQDISNETPRRDDGDFTHWSNYSLNEVSTVIGPFVGSLDSTITHFFYLEARDNLGFVSLFTIRLRIVKPRFDRELLVVDDLYGTATGVNALHQVPYVGGYPMEAEQDSFYYAVGGKPDSMKILGDPHLGAPDDTLSDPGCFVGFDYDTLDYRFYPNEAVLLEDLARYKVVVWYTDQNSANRTGTKFGSITPKTGIRVINSTNQLNTLAVYLTQRGKAWILGDGMPTAIANGYWSRVATSGVARLPYTAGSTPADILKSGDFLFDFMHMQSEMNTAGTSSTSLTLEQQLQSCIPYLPQFATVPPGSPPPPDRSLDPRIGPSAERTAVLWNDLPRLTLASYRNANLNPALRSINLTWVITKPNFVTEGVGDAFQSVIDTLYLCQARSYDPDQLQVPPSDGFPNATFYHGSQHGELVWFGFPLHFFERDQARQVTRIVLRNLGLTPTLAAHPTGANGFVSISGASREIDWGATVDNRRKSR